MEMPFLTKDCVWQKLRDIKFLLIDEISMVRFEMLCMVDSRLKNFNRVMKVFSGPTAFNAGAGKPGGTP